MKRRVIAYWLIPAEPERELFRKIISILAKQYDAPVFEPHLTVLATRQDGKAVAKFLRTIKVSPIRLRILGVASSSRFTKTLFVRLGPAKSLDAIVVDLAAGVGSRAKTVRDPHVSLLYKKAPAATKRELARTIKLPFREIVFDRLKAVRCVSPTESKREVEAWRVIATRLLR